MKIEQKANKEYIPVTLTFETLEELTRFTRTLGGIKHTNLPIPYDKWSHLDDIAKTYLT